jgi:hypothetical protein
MPKYSATRGHTWKGSVAYSVIVTKLLASRNIGYVRSKNPTVGRAGMEIEGTTEYEVKPKVVIPNHQTKGPFVGLAVCGRLD